MVKPYQIANRQPVLVFCLLVSTDLAAILLDIGWLRYFTKPLLMPAVILLALYPDFKVAGKKLILTGLFFSWLGDIFLLLEFRMASFFILGLACFLITHACYIIYFLSINSTGPSFLKKQPIFILIVLCYCAGLVWLLLPNLGELKIPVMLYSGVICGMLLCSMHIYLKVNAPANRYFLAGAILFVVSDSILAIDKFYQPLPLAGTWLMMSYCAAQFCIVGGLLKSRISDK